MSEYLSKLFAGMQFYALGCGSIYVDDGKNKISKMSLNYFFSFDKNDFLCFKQFDA